ncbi:hypothetical protein [Methylobacterium durans]|jgi:hypothetical protein|uniref:hypothetical protein n=1 Tax=Methylobacterium durans TaxID=2202825 RepID=UPI001F4138FA|nr:hypothetical protein [Methylobacterium durans]
MNRLVAATVFAAALAMPLAAQAGPDGSRQAAGGAFMSSYIGDPYHDPRSLHAQRRGTGQILGQPMLAEEAGVRMPARAGLAGTWASGLSGTPIR